MYESQVEENSLGGQGQVVAASDPASLVERREVHSWKSRIQLLLISKMKRKLMVCFLSIYLSHTSSELKVVSPLIFTTTQQCHNNGLTLLQFVCKRFVAKSL